jgi:hypothetical protein
VLDDQPTSAIFDCLCAQGKVRTMRRIATPLLALLLIAGHHARAADTKGIITLSCEGTVRSGPGPADVERVNERVIFVNLAEHTVTGFVTNTGSALIANIVHVCDTSVGFIGDSTSSSVFGTIDRVTGTHDNVGERQDPGWQDHTGTELLSRLQGCEPAALTDAVDYFHQPCADLRTHSQRTQFECA